jgi:hypothetical protein
MVSWSTLSDETRYLILFQFSRIIVQDTVWCEKHPECGNWGMEELGYSQNTEPYGPYGSYAAARLVNREFRETLDAIQIDGLSLLPWLKKKTWMEVVEFYANSAVWEYIIIPGSRMWDACAERSKTIKRERRLPRV